MSPLLGWLGLACLSGAWFLASGFYGEAHPLVWPSLVVAGTLLLIAVPIRLPGRRVAAVAGLLALPAALLDPWPWRVGSLLVLIGLAVTVLLSRWRWTARIGGGALLAGTVWLVQALTLLCYEGLTARWPSLLPFLTDVLAAVARLLGIDVARDGASLVLFSMRTKHPLAATWTQLVDPVSTCFLTGGLALIAVASARRLRAAVALTATVALWLFGRSALLMAVYLHRVLRTKYDAPLDFAGLFWDRWIHLSLLSGVVLLAWRFVRLTRVGAGPAGAEPRGHRWRPAMATLAAVAAALVLTMSVTWKPSGQRKEGRILVDEYHCRVDDWSTWRWPQKEYDTTSTLRAFDENWYGSAAPYNYASLYEYLSRHYTMSRLEAPVHDRVLGACDVLVLKVPSRYFSKDEIAAVRRFVAAGGGLLLLGEHTSVFGSGVCLNQIAEGFGFRFRYDCLFGVDDVFQQRYDPTPVPHPVVQHMGPLDFAVSCSIDPGTSAGCAVIRDNSLKSLDADYHVSNFYPQPDDRPEMIHGSFVQLWATRHGGGRVLAFTDSTIFANFGVFEPGKKELFLGMMEWLNHRPGLRLWWMAVLGLCLGLTVVLQARRVPWVLLLAGALLGWVAGATSARALHRTELPAPPELRPMVRVAFERSLCTDTGFSLSGFVAGGNTGFGLFERGFQRLTERGDAGDPGRTWVTFRTEGVSALDADLVVLIHPNQSPGPGFKKRLEDCVSSGGKLLILDSPVNTESTANALLAPFGVSVDRGGTLQGEVSAGAGLPSIPLEAALAVSGGTPFASVGGKPVATWVRHGKGSVIVLGFGTRFSDANMGVTGDLVPDEALRKVFDFEYRLLEAIVDDSLPSK